MAASSGASRIDTVVFDEVEALTIGGEPAYVGTEIVGQTTSAAFGYRVGRPVGLLSLNSPSAVERVEIDIAGDRVHAAISTACAYDPTGTRMRLDD